MLDHHPRNFFPASVVDKINKPTNFFHNGRFFIHGGFDETISTEIIPNLVSEIEAKKKSKGAEIEIYVNSFGGYLHEALNVIGLMERAKCEGIVVKTYVYGIASSAGSIVAMAGTKGNRYVGPYALHLCHLGRESSGWVSNEIEHDRANEWIKKNFENVRILYRKYAKVKNLDRLIRDDGLRFVGEEIIQNGLADLLA